MEWRKRAQGLAELATDPDSRWRTPVARTPRHQLAPRWWERDASGQWALRDGPSDPRAWADAAYADRSLITQVDGLHADKAEPHDHPEGLPESSATQAGLLVRMLCHARVGDGLSLLDLGTGAGGLTAYACHRLGDQHVTSLDVDPYLVSAAGERLAAMGHHPRMVTADATEYVPGAYDRVVCTVALAPGRGLASVIRAVRPGGRIATTLARTSLIVTGWKNEAGEVEGRVERGASAEWTDPPEVRQAGPQRLWSALERIRNRLNTEGALPLLGAKALITPDGAVHLSRGHWHASMGSPSAEAPR
ncbi:methyltransferase domain-containing protein [Streptomyces albidoflavus]|uniref:methyltransferase domain-containing protein n=1 Tax=Streptomyces TaxID=1883 RepID=UPI00056B5A03|nr:methyltransferase domain-containing protein [Streptomyces sp. NRRL F-6628]